MNMMLATRNRMQAAQRAPLIVHITRQFAPSRGGLEDVVANLCRNLVSRGYRIRIVTLNRVFTAPETLLPAHEIIDGIEIVRIPWKGSTRYPLAPQVFRHLADADLIHVHAMDFFFDALPLGRLLHRKPLVATTHGGFFHTRKFASLKKLWFQTVTRLSAAGYKRIVCCSASDAAMLSQVAPRRLTVIENGANIGKFHDRAAATPQRRIVTIGRFSVNKRIERLIAMMPALIARHPGWSLDIVGAPYDLDGTVLMQHAAELGVADHVRVHENIPDEAVAELIGQASFFASASEYEGFGIVAIEAMSAGLSPVLQPNDAYRILANRHDVIRLTDFSAPEAAAALFETAYAGLAADGPALRTAAIAQAEAYSWNGVTSRYIDVYDEALGNTVSRLRSIA